MGETQEALVPQDQRRQSGCVQQIPKLQVGECYVETNDLVRLYGKEND